MALPFATPPPLAAGFTMARCTPDDIPQMVSIYLACFKPTRFSYWWPSSLEMVRRWNEARYRLRFRDPAEHQFKVVDDESGKIVAFARWTVPEGMNGLAEGFQVYDNVGEGGFDGSESQWMRNPPEGSKVELYHELFGAMGEMSKKWDAKQKLDLSLLCTHPEYQGRGLAGALLQSVLAVADRQGFTTYLDGLENAVPVYRRYGFKTVDQLEFDLARAGREGKATIDIMLREPQTSQVT